MLTAEKQILGKEQNAEEKKAYAKTDGAAFHRAGNAQETDDKKGDHAHLQNACRAELKQQGIYKGKDLTKGGNDCGLLLFTFCEICLVNSVIGNK